MTEVNMTEEKYDFEPATVADALAWVQRMNEEVHTLPITKEEIEATLNFAGQQTYFYACEGGITYLGK